MKKPISKYVIFVAFFSILLIEYGCYKEKKTNLKLNFFELLPSSKTGVLFKNTIEENYKNFFDNFNYVYNGGGVTIGDINNDGLSDLYFTANDSSNKLYLNKGNFKFEDITLDAGVSGGNGWHNGVVMADINGDNYLDIYVCRGGMKTEKFKERENLLFINQKNNTFKEQAEIYGLNDKGYSTHASFFDFDNDNDLDVYITNRPDEFYISLDKIKENKLHTNDDFRDKLYVNENGIFKEQGEELGIVNNFGFGLSLVTSDVNNDGFIDVYVANDFSENDYLYMNNGNGTFTESIKEATNHISFYSMGTDIADINNDGYEDILVTEMLASSYIRSKTSMPPMDVKRFEKLKKKGFHNQYMHNMLHLNRGETYFSDISQMAGISKTDWSWSSLIADFNNNGYNDVFISNGYKRDLFDRDSYTKRKQLYERNKGKFRTLEEMSKGLAKEIVNLYPTQEITNYFFTNNKNLTFTNRTKEWGLNTPSFSNGAAIGDLDNDGDLDLVVNNVDKEAFIYRNQSKNNNTYIRIKLLGPKGNSTGLGSKVKLFYKDKQQYKDFKTVRGYLSSVEPILHFGLENEKKIKKIEITWLDGKVSTLENIDVNQLLTVNYSDAIFFNETKEKETIETVFTEETNNYFLEPFVHKENEFDDYEKQVLLPKKYSVNGPFITVGDVNGDGLDDFYVGGASEQSGVLYFQSLTSSFVKSKQSSFEKDKTYEDMQSHFFDADGDGDLDLYVVSGGYEFEPLSNKYQDRLYLNDGIGNFKKSKGLPKIDASGSCIAVNDYDNDGDLDLFIGGRIVPNYYPFPAQSMLLENDGNGKFVDVSKKIAPKLSKLGMVTSAVWSDVNSDGYSDLIVVGEWMSIKVFRNVKGIFIDESEKYGLKETVGWWNKIIASDYDKDGDVDFIVGNMGLNHKFKASKTKPFHIYANDFDLNGNYDVFLAKYNEKGDQVPVRGLDCSSQQIPSISKRFPSFEKFANANIKDVLGSGIEYGLHYELNMFESVIINNEKGKFVLKPLPNQAQVSAIQGILVNDFDEDGIIDLLISGNQFESEIETSPADASIGLLLKGSVTGVLQEISHFKSGFFTSKNVKEMKSINLGKDNKKGVLIGVNDGKLRLYMAQ